MNEETCTGYGITTGSAARYASGQQPDCDDSGPGSDGSVFTDSSPQVTAWAFEGFDPAVVLGVRVERDSYTVYFSDSMPSRDRASVYRDLND